MHRLECLDHLCQVQGTAWRGCERINEPDSIGTREPNLIAEECISALTRLELALLCKVFIDADFVASAVYPCRNQGYRESDDGITPIGLPLGEGLQRRHARR
jgi:hypothetical protein